jgi:hypothetical protein
MLAAVRGSTKRRIGFYVVGMGEAFLVHKPGVRRKPCS